MQIFIVYNSVVLLLGKVRATFTLYYRRLILFFLLGIDEAILKLITVDVVVSVVIFETVAFNIVDQKPDSLRYNIKIFIFRFHDEIL